MKCIVMITGINCSNGKCTSQELVQAEVIDPNYTTGCKVQNNNWYWRSQGSASTGDVLAGAIIGGVIGNQFGKGKGNDAATVLGVVIIGAGFIHKKNGNKTIVGYKQVQQCNTIYIETVADKIVGYQSTFKTTEGEIYTFQTKSQWAVGTIVFLNKTVS